MPGLNFLLKSEENVIRGENFNCRVGFVLFNLYSKEENVFGDLSCCVFYYQDLIFRDCINKKRRNNICIGGRLLLKCMLWRPMTKTRERVYQYFNTVFVIIRPMTSHINDPYCKYLLLRGKTTRRLDFDFFTMYYNSFSHWIITDKNY